MQLHSTDNTHQEFMKTGFLSTSPTSELTQVKRWLYITIEDAQFLPDINAGTRAVSFSLCLMDPL